MATINKSQPAVSDTGLTRVSKPYSYPDSIPAVAQNWKPSEQHRCAEVAQKVYTETKDEQKAIFACIGAVKQMRQKSEVNKANHAYAKCMLCKENPPDNDALWQDGDGVLHRAWSCNKCYPSWYAEKGEMVIHVHKVEGVAPSRYRPIRHSPKEKKAKKVSKDTLLKINGQQVTVGELAKSWLAGQPKEVEPTPIESDVPDGTEVIEKAWEVEIVKADEEKRLLYGVALEPQTKDSQNDTVDETEIEKAAHGFMIKSRLMDLQHKEVVDPKKATPVESYIALVDMEIGGKPIKRGSWIVVTKIFDDEIWKMVKRGEIRGYSIRGFGKRKPVA